MTLNPEVMRAVERLDYRVTVGDVAAQAGLNLDLAQQQLVTLAAEAGGHLQVAESGEVVYRFPGNFRTVLRAKFLRLRLKEWWNRIWKILFYLIRISFAIVLIVSIVLIAVAIWIILMAAQSANNQNSDRGGDGGMVFVPNFWFNPHFFYIFFPNYYDLDRPNRRRFKEDEKPSLNFLEAVFSFLFGDGNPNRDLEERRWRTIGSVIRNHRGAIVAEQIAPYLDTLGQGNAETYEEYMLPVLSRFHGRPEVSPEGEIVYHFPELQATASDQGQTAVPAYLKEFTWRFSQAGAGQIILATGMGVVNFVGALALGQLLADGTVAAQLGGVVAFVQSIYWGLLGYGTAFLTIPLLRYFWVQWRNQKISRRNESRQERAVQLNAGGERLQTKLAFAQQFAAHTVISEQDVIYTTDRDLTEQELEQADRIDAEWQERLRQGS